LYFETAKAPFDSKLIALCCYNSKIINNLCVVSNVSESVAPHKKHLISVSTVGLSSVDDTALEAQIKNELLTFFGSEVLSWKMIKSYHIRYALPNQKQVNDVYIENLRINAHTYSTSDALSNGSIQNALKSGRLVAEDISKTKNN
jgi:hypothetical protein